MSLKGTENLIDILIVSEELEKRGIVSFEDVEKRKPTFNAFGFLCADFLRERKEKNDLCNQIKTTKKRFAVLLIFVSIFSIACGFFASLWYADKRDAYIAHQLFMNHLPVELSFSESLVSYDGLGKDTKIVYRCQGREWNTGDVILVGKNCVIEATIVEKDPSTNDKAFGKIKLTSLPNAGKDSAKITVKEIGGGGHSGSATYRVSCQYKPKISFWAVLTH